MRAVIANIRNLGHGIFQNLARHRYVPLPAFGWSEIFVDSVKARAVADAGDGIPQAGTNGIKTPESRIVAKPGISVAAPIGIHHRGPRRVTGQAQDIFDHVRATHEATESRTHGGLAIALDVPGHTYSWLETFIVWMPQ